MLKFVCWVRAGNRSGKPQRESAAVHSVIDTPIGRHSEKPQEARERIVQLMGENTKRIELFASDAAEGWDCWGNEIEPCLEEDFNGRTAQTAHGR